MPGPGECAFPEAPVVGNVGRGRERGDEASPPDKDGSLEKQNDHEADDQRRKGRSGVSAFGAEGGEKDAEDPGVGEGHAGEGEIEQRLAGGVVPSDAERGEEAEQGRGDEDGASSDAEVMSIVARGAEFSVGIVDERRTHGADGAVDTGQSSGEEAGDEQAGESGGNFVEHELGEGALASAFGDERGCGGGVAHEIGSKVVDMQEQAEREKEHHGGDAHEDALQDRQCGLA